MKEGPPRQASGDHATGKDESAGIADTMLDQARPGDIPTHDGRWETPRDTQMPDTPQVIATQNIPEPGNGSETDSDKVQIDSPDSIPNNYHLSKRDGLIIAKSRANHTMTRAEYEDQKFWDNIPEKQRGIVIKEKVLENGDTLYVAERASSKSASKEAPDAKKKENPDGGDSDGTDSEVSSENPDDRNSNPPDSSNNGGKKEKDDSKEKGPKQPEAILPGISDFDLDKFEEKHIKRFRKLFRPDLGDRVYYDEESDGSGAMQGHRLGLKFELEDRSYIDWREILEEAPADKKISSAEDLFVILKASGGPLGDYSGYIKDGYIYEIVHRKVKQGDELVDQAYATKTELAKLPNLMIGQQFGDRFTLDSVEIAHNGGKDLFSKGDKMFKSYSRPDGENPFIEAAEMIRRIESSQLGLPVIEGQTKPSVSGLDWQEALSIDARTGIDRRVDNPDRLARLINAYGARFEDETYVPTPEEFTALQKLAEKVEAVSVGGDDRGVYRLTDGTPLDSQAANKFIENMRSQKWLLTNHQEDSYTAALFSETFTSIQKRILFSVKSWSKENKGEWNTGESSILSIEDFRKAKVRLGDLQPTAGKTKKEKEDIDNEAGRLYKKYLEARNELSHSIKSGTRRNQHLRKDKNSTSLAIQGYAAHFKQKEEDERQRREQEATRRNRERNQSTANHRQGSRHRRTPLRTRGNTTPRLRGAGRKIREKLQINRPPRSK